MAAAPFFSVIMATFGRGKHIAPAIRSALAQSFQSFELIVVGDGCRDETRDIVLGFGSDRVRWLGLPDNSGSQSAPNNAGLQIASGRYVAYLGHDDIWATDHLEALHAHATTGRADFVVSGCVYYGPPGSGQYFITGMFEDAEAPFQHFFPPTSLAHKCTATERIGAWKSPRAIRAPVDCDFLLRAAQAGLRFVSTGKITAHKFAAGHRYLSYLRTDSEEQNEMLDRLTMGSGIDLGAIVEAARQQGHFMAMGYPDFAAFAPGEHFERNRRNKGISRPALRPLEAREVIEQGTEERALDWYGPEARDPEAHGEGRWFRWSGPNPRPKILIPFTGASARVEIEVAKPRPDGKLAQLWVEGDRVDARVETDADGVTWLTGYVRLSPTDYTVLTLGARTFRPADLGTSQDARSLGLAVGRVVVEPVAQDLRKWRASSNDVRTNFHFGPPFRN